MPRLGHYITAKTLPPNPVDDWFSNRAHIERAILGCIKSAHNDHGDDGPIFFASAAKRVYHQLKAFRREWWRDRLGQPSGQILRERAGKLERRAKELHQLAMLADQIETADD